MSDYWQSFFETDQPIKHGLPAFTYTSMEFAKKENQSIFMHRWVFVGFAHELASIGDVLPVEVAGRPFFLVRNQQNEINAFHNVCRHRCLKLVETKKNCGSLIQCPYHSWLYDLDGALQAAPYFGGRDRSPPPGFSLAEHGLTAVKCRTWHDWIFINMDDEGESFEQFIAPLANQLKDVDLNRIKPVTTLDFGVLETNWKALMENFIEPYHVQFVHRTTTSQPLRDHFTIIDRHCLGSGCDIGQGRSIDDAGTLAVTSRFLTLFPNFVIGTYAPDQIGVHLNRPLGAGQTHQRRVIYLDESNQPSAAQIEKMRLLWHDVHREDHAICERLQAGRVSDVAAQGGYLSPCWEDSVRQFQELVAESVLQRFP